MSKSKILNKSDVEAGALLVIISAPSGCGKTTIVDRLLKRHPDWVRSISVTSRPTRAGEKQDQDYHFVTPKAFKQMESKGKFLESANVFGNLYGTPSDFVFDQLKQGKKVFLAIDVQGTKKVQKTLDRELPMLSFFILPPSVKVLRERLEGRNTDSPEEIDKRLDQAQNEIKEAVIYDHTVVNQSLEQTVLEIEKLIEKFEMKV